MTSIRFDSHIILDKYKREGKQNPLILSKFDGSGQSCGPDLGR